MRIALITPNIALDGGMAVHVQRSSRILREAGHRVVVVAGDGADPDDGVHAPGLTTEGLSRQHGSALARRLAGEADVFHFHGVDDPWLVRRMSERAASVVSAHGWSGCPSGDRYFGAARECFRPRGALCVPAMLLVNCKHRRDPRYAWRYYQAGGRRLAALGAADVSIAYSAAVERHLAGNRLDNVARVVLPVEIPAATRPAPGGSPRVLYIGRLTAVKGVAVLLRSAQHFDAAIDVCGDGPERPRLEALADRLRLRERITFHGWQSRGQVARLIDQATLVVVPSLYPEPFGMVGPEAMARARPVVGSAQGGIADWLHDGDNGAMVRPGAWEELGDTIAELLADPQRLTLMAAAARHSVETVFSGAAHLESVLAAYATALAARDERRRGAAAG